MRNFLVIALVASSLLALAQKEEEVEFYTDSDVSRSVVGIGLRFDPFYANRSLLGNDPLNSSSGFSLGSSSSKGRFGYNLGGDLYFKISERLELGLGVGYGKYGFQTEVDHPDPSLNYNLDSTSNYRAATNLSTINVPLMINFNTRMNDLWSLEIVPMVELVFVNTYQVEFEDKSTGELQLRDLKADARGHNWNVGLGLGGTYHITPKFGVFVRGQFKYLLTPLIEGGTRPREVFYSVGATTGLRYYF